MAKYGVASGRMCPRGSASVRSLGPAPAAGADGLCRQAACCRHIATAWRAGSGNGQEKGRCTAGNSSRASDPAAHAASAAGARHRARVGRPWPWPSLSWARLPAGPSPSPHYSCLVRATVSSRSQRHVAWGQAPCTARLGPASGCWPAVLVSRPSRGRILHRARGVTGRIQAPGHVGLAVTSVRPRRVRRQKEVETRAPDGSPAFQRLRSHATPVSFPHSPFSWSGASPGPRPHEGGARTG